MSAETLAPAKVNLFLHVGPPEADGFHPICSWMAFADLGDRVSVYEADALEVKVSGPFAPALAREPNNLVLRAARALLAKADGPRRPFGLMLEKALPVAAGLGGGSSDAGAVLRLLRQALDIGLGDDELEAVAAGLGADGAACLWARPVIAEGRGERLSPAPSTPPLDVVLVNPGVPVATAQVYARLDALKAWGSAERPALPETFEDAAEVAGFLSLTRNDLEVAAVEVAPEVGDALDFLRAEPETLLARMSGSGGACFALCASDYEAETLAERLEALRPAWWIRRTRLCAPQL
ncbi:4-(cytidine 5'-diphospho)-2-C-methyl-D-erythritol kinase [Phenylobacterium sp.]|jgi:4-diphosphocytidyl-2-C-methyl-D-erythritol kinase|uniref:4-(cytidine 5'-diphospho)-2-C-methyl-D-erythritol kinase n=1 Tax=Phenylobacterium sp. TaxID=1871053 RepID=UPI002E2FC20C|nr:4-(cytidine 5'-diphospho)-2-C-methyl-D-erythritol kinase [Phenylobacterium sp.]HEX2558873.1 4-(cytidine 5'-diphospho)-2-C-methyl-D-erythritol kinase [Phenylobacterium sp.]